MDNCKFYFHSLEIEDVENSAVISLFDAIKTETESDGAPFYAETEISKLHIQILDKQSEENDTFFFGRLIHSKRPTDFKEEKAGDLIDLEIDGSSGICHKSRGIIYFMIHLNGETGEKIVMMEDIPFAINVGGLVRYLSERLSIDTKKINTKQKLGRDLVNIIEATGESCIKIAKIRFKRNVTTEEIQKIGVVEEAFEKLKEQELDAELILKWDKNKGEKVKDFMLKFFKIDNVNRIPDVDFGEFLRTLYFEIDNTAHPHINMKDDVIRFYTPEKKEYYSNHEDTLFESMKEDFLSKKESDKL